MSSTRLFRPAPPRHVAVKRSDPVYNAHSYLTKVPVPAITPFIDAFTEPGDLVLDPFAGSGMTGVAAAVCGRRAVLRDINTLGRHIGTNYVNLVDEEALRQTAREAMDKAAARIGDVYAVRCEECGGAATLSRTTWTLVCGCRRCGTTVNYYRALEAASWSKRAVVCPACDDPFVLRGAERLCEQPVLDTISCTCSEALRDQRASEPLHPGTLEGLTWPDIPIGPDRQMYHASALARNNLTTTASFFSERNLGALAALCDAIEDVADEALRQKLLFAFTAILARASKRYQWSVKRPLNAAHQHYYIAPVFLEWNVFDLFARKVEALIRSDSYIREKMAMIGADDTPEIDYQLGSADNLDLEDESVDYVFTDPPFGSNIFYSDMSLFQEAWLGDVTDHAEEAVVDRSGNGCARRTAERYEQLITGALRECYRVLKPGRWLSFVFSNSSGEMWALVQRAVREAGFALDPDYIAILDKGQRSVKGLASGYENVVTVDLILSMRRDPDHAGADLAPAPEGYLAHAVENVLAVEAGATPSHVYVGVVRDFLRHHLDVEGVHMTAIAAVLAERGYEADARTGRLRRPSAAQIKP